MGTPGFATATLRELIDKDYDVVGVVTVPDKPAGRGYKLSESDVKKFAKQTDLPIFQPEKLKSKQFLADLKALNADLFIVVAFRMLPTEVWQIPKLGTFNLHGALLPNYRGAAPINWAVINGEKETGVTTFFIDEKIDTGDILLNAKIPVDENDTAGIVHDKLMAIGAELVCETVDKIAAGTIKPVKQKEILDQAEIKNAPKIFTETCMLNWNNSAEEIHNLIRGLSPFPGAFFKVVEDGNEFIVKVYKSKISEGVLTKGVIESDGKKYWHIGTGKGVVSLLEVQFPGKKRMDIKSFLSGNKVNNLSIMV